MQHAFNAVQVATGIVPIPCELPLVFQFENVLSHEVCDAAVAYIVKAKVEGPNNSGVLPWHDGDSIPWQEITEPTLKARLYAYRLLLTQIASHCYQTILYPAFTDLVMWREGKYQDEHKDNGYGLPGEEHLNLRSRKFSSVTYLNDGFEGGETFIRGADDEYHLNTPKKGSVLLFASDERCPHGVTAVRSGTRFTLPIWFTDMPSHCERASGFVDATAVGGS